MSNLPREIAAAFRHASLRSTPQRFAVLEFLMRRPVHATAEEILSEINRTDPRASRATVYNSLRTLIQAGLVRELAGEGKAARFDASVHRHHHFICDRCGALEDVEWFDVPVRSGHAGLRRRVRTCEVILRGTCERCGSRKKGEK